MDLRDVVTDAQRAAFVAMGLTDVFGIVTAADPMGVIQSPNRNDELAARLRRDVVTRNVPFVPVDACSPDRSHCEHSFAISQDRDAVIELACRYDQLAAFWFDGAAFWIVPARSRTTMVRLPVEV